VSTQHHLHVGPLAPSDGIEMSYRPTPTHDRKVLTSVLDRIEQVREVARCLGCADL
jgi:hypothetical protein